MAKDDQFVDDVDEPKGDAFGSALVVVTTLVLIAAFLVVEFALKPYGVGMFK